MLDIAVRLVAAFCADATHGINEMAQGLPRATMVPGIFDDAPPLVALCNDADDESVAAALEPPEVPAFMFWGDSAADVDVRGYKIAKEVIIAGAFVTEDGADPLASVRACGYILRAGILTLGRYNSQENSKGFRKLNGISIHQITSVTEQRMTAVVGTRKMWGFLDIRATVVETLQ
jgi:hypothetical protein